MITTKWIDTNKGDAENPDYMSRLVGREIDADACPDLCAATPPLESLRYIIGKCASGEFKIARPRRQSTARPRRQGTARRHGSMESLPFKVLPQLMKQADAFYADEARRRATKRRGSGTQKARMAVPLRVSAPW